MRISENKQWVKKNHFLPSSLCQKEEKFAIALYNNKNFSYPAITFIKQEQVSKVKSNLLEYLVFILLIIIINYYK